MLYYTLHVATCTYIELYCHADTYQAATLLPCWSGRGLTDPDTPTDLRILARVTDLGIVSILNILIGVQSHRRIVLQVNRLTAILRRLLLLRLVIGNRPDNNLPLWWGCRLSGLRTARRFGRYSRSGSPGGLLLLLRRLNYGWHNVFLLLLFPRSRSPWTSQSSGPVPREAARVWLVNGRWRCVHGCLNDRRWAGPLLYGYSCWSGTLGVVRPVLGGSSSPGGSVCPPSAGSLDCEIQIVECKYIKTTLQIPEFEQNRQKSIHTSTCTSL